MMRRLSNGLVTLCHRLFVSSFCTYPPARDGRVAGAEGRPWASLILHLWACGISGRGARQRWHGGVPRAVWVLGLAAFGRGVPPVTQVWMCGRKEGQVGGL